LDRKWFAHADRVRAHKVDLQLADLIADYVHIAQLSHAGRNGVRNFVTSDQRIDNCTRALDGFARVRIEQYRPFLGGDFTYRLERQIISVDVESLQDCSQFPVF